MSIFSYTFYTISKIYRVGLDRQDSEFPACILVSMLQGINICTVFGSSIASVMSETFYSKTFGSWMGRNGKFYSTDWGGNQYTGGKLKFAGQWGSAIKTGGNILSLGSAYFSFRQMFQAETTLGKIEHGVDVGMSIIGMYNPYTFAASLYYSGVMKNYPAIQKSVNQQLIDRANMMKKGFIPVGHPGFPMR